MGANQTQFKIEITTTVNPSWKQNPRAIADWIVQILMKRSIDKRNLLHIEAS